MTVPRLEFLKNEAGEREGLADAGIETFRDAPYASCAREAGQNSRDAEAGLPVRMTFNVSRIAHQDFPAHGQLVKALKACASGAGQEKEKEFFSNAITVANRPDIPILEIADYNTKGLVGPPDEPGTPFHALLKATGVSAKESETSGGSFGIGKNASFAVSDLQMVLYSTLYQDRSGHDSFAAQGKVKLVSHVDEEGEKRRATGYWGDPNGFAAVTSPGSVPGWMGRRERGTSIFCMGFRDSSDWAEHMTSSLVTNFFAAIYREEMVFEVGNGKFLINRNTLEALLENEEIRRAAENSGHLLDLEFAGQLYRCLVSPNAEEHLLTLDGLGDMKARVLIEEGMPRRIGFVRNGMLITDNLRHFGHPLQRFPGSRDFVALVEPAGDAAGRLLKRLENPAHDNFSEQRIADPTKRGIAGGAMRKLGKTLRETIKASTGAEQLDAVILDELGRFFADPGRADTPPDPNAEHDPEKYLFVPPVVRKRRRTTTVPIAGEEGGRRGTGEGGGDGGGTGPRPGSGSGGPGTRGTHRAIQLREVRNLIRRNPGESAQSRTLFFSSDIDGLIRLTLQATGVDVPEALRVRHSDIGNVDNGDLLLTVNAGQRNCAVVAFEQAYDGPIEVIAVAEGMPEVHHADH